jgi:hypothetical protein
MDPDLREKTPEVTAAVPRQAAKARFSWQWQGVAACLTLWLKWGLALLFIFAGAVKLWDPRAFAQAISQYGLVPEGLIPVLALGLPIVEVLAGLGLLVNARGSLGAILAMLLLFIGVLGYAVLNDMDIDCGCFTAAELAARGSVKAAFIQDLGFLAAAIFLLWRRRQSLVERGKPLLGTASLLRKSISFRKEKEQ